MSRICSIIKRLKQPFERRPSRRCHYNKRGVAKRGFRSKDEAERFIEAKGLKGYGAYRCKVCEMWHVGRASPLTPPWRGERVRIINLNYENMQDRFKVGDYVIFRRGMHKVADMLNTSFYDVLTSVYEITGTEGRCYLMKSDNGYGRVWKIRRSRIDRIGEKVVFVYEGMQLIGDELKRLGRDLVKKSVVRREKRHSTDLLDEQLYPWVSGSVDTSERLLQNRAKEYIEEHIKGDAAKQKELADVFVKSVENIIKDVNKTNDAIMNIFKGINGSESKPPSKGDYCRYYNDIIKTTYDGELQCKSCPIKCVHSGLDSVDYLFKEEQRKL